LVGGIGLNKVGEGERDKLADKGIANRREPERKGKKKLVSMGVCLGRVPFDPRKRGEDCSGEKEKR